MERKSSTGSFIGGAAAAAAAGAGSGMGGGTGDRRVLVEWHPFLSDFFVAGGEELQLFEVRRQQRGLVDWAGVGGGGGAPNPR